MPPKKKTKSASAKTESALGELPRLLTQLNGGKALDDTFSAAIQAASTDNEGRPQSEAHQSTISKLFADHAGVSPDVVVGNAIRVVVSPCRG